MNHKLYYWVTLCALVFLLASCSLLGPKSEVIKCSGTQELVSTTPTESQIVNNIRHTYGEEVKFNQESTCPEMNGVWTVYTSYIKSGEVQWGTFIFETAYEGGGTYQGTFNATLTLDGFKAEAISYDATGSLVGSQLKMTAQQNSSSGKASFEATLENIPQE